MHWRTWHSKTVSSIQVNIQVQCSSCQIPAGIFVDIDKIILKFMGKDEGTRVVKAILKKNDVGGISVPGSNTSCSVERPELSAGSCCLAAWLCPTLRPHRLWHGRPPCPSPSPGSRSNSCLLSRWCRQTSASSVIPFFFCLQSFPASGSFLMMGFLHQMAKVLELQLQHQSFQWIFRTDVL